MVLEGEQYRYLLSIIEYLEHDSPDENCLNYIAKSLCCLLPKHLTPFLEFLQAHPHALQLLVAHTHYPSIGSFLLKITTDEHAPTGELG